MGATKERGFEERGDRIVTARRGMEGSGGEKEERSVWMANAVRGFNRACERVSKVPGRRGGVERAQVLAL